MKVKTINIIEKITNTFNFEIKPNHKFAAPVENIFTFPLSAHILRLTFTLPNILNCVLVVLVLQLLQYSEPQLKFYSLNTKYYTKTV